MNSIVIPVASPIRDESNNVIAVLLAILPIEFLGDITNSIHAEGDSYA